MRKVAWSVSARSGTEVTEIARSLLGDLGESCDVGLKGDLFRGIQLSEQFSYYNKVFLLRF